MSALTRDHFPACDIQPNDLRMHVPKYACLYLFDLCLVIPIYSLMDVGIQLLNS